MSGQNEQLEDRFGQAKRIAEEIVEEARVQLMMKFRFLDVALFKMKLRPAITQGRYALATDGACVYYEPYTVIGRFDVSIDEVVRDYLHVVMHCLFRHPFDTARSQADAWWLVCDVLAEKASMDLCGPRFESPLDGERRKALSELTVLCGGNLTPGNLYGLIVRSERAEAGADDGLVGGGRLNEYRALFERDFHGAWPAFVPVAPSGPADLPPDTTDGEDDRETSDGRDMRPDGEGQDPSGDGQDIWDQTAERTPQDAQDDGSSMQSGSPDAQSVADDALRADDEEPGQVDDAPRSENGRDRGQARRDEPEAEEDAPRKEEESQEEHDWERISKQVEMDLQTFSKDWGFEAGDFTKSLSIANRKRYDYSSFLRRFALLTESMEINDDEFDYVFYLYGMHLYGNMPLIEPLEYRETQRIRDFAICIDTSESCDGDLVKLFVEHTFNILKEQEDYAHSVNIHIIQCDAKVQSDIKISDLRDVDRFIENFEVRGLGGTDFRPAFAYVDRLKATGELAGIKGLIYFTDGLGWFPEKAPDYDVAFVFMDNGASFIPDVPPWAMRVLIDQEGINRFKSEMR